MKQRTLPHQELTPEERTSWGEDESSNLVGHPSKDIVTIKIPYMLDTLLHLPALHAIFFKGLAQLRLT